MSFLTPQTDFDGVKTHFTIIKHGLNVRKHHFTQGLSPLFHNWDKSCFVSTFILQPNSGKKSDQPNHFSPGSFGPWKSCVIMSFIMRKISSLPALTVLKKSQKIISLNFHFTGCTLVYVFQFQFFLLSSSPFKISDLSEIKQRKYISKS